MASMIVVTILVLYIGVSNSQVLDLPNWLDVPWNTNGFPVPVDPDNEDGPSFELPEFNPWSTNAEFSPWPTTAEPDPKIDCRWAAYKAPGPCERHGANGYRQKKTREKIVAKNGGKDCAGLDYEYITCNEHQYVASVFLKTVTTAATQGSGRRTISTAAKGTGLNPCPTPFKGKSGGLRMLGKCETRRRKRRSTTGEIEVFEEPLKDTGRRVKREGGPTPPPIKTTLHRDVLFLIDESGSVGKTKFQLELRMAKALVSKFCGTISIERGKTQVGIASFDSIPHHHLDFDTLFERSKIMDFMDTNVGYTKATDYRTCLVKALEWTRTDMMTIGRGARMTTTGTERLVILLTDGCANCESGVVLANKLKALANGFNQQKIGFLTFFIGKGDHCMNIMKNLADGSQCYQVFKAEDWGQFEVMVQAIESQPCHDAWFIGESCN